MSGDARRIGIDYGGTTTKIIVIEGALDAPSVVHRSTFPTPRGEGALDRLASEVRAVVPEGVESGGVTVPGVLDDDRGLVVRSVNLPWLDGLEFGVELSDRLGYGIRPVHDGRAAAGAEASLGAGRGFADSFVIALGTGVAGAYVEGGVVRRGAHGAAGEIGHITQDPLGRPCTCGQRGCLETFIGGAHLAERWTARSGRPASARDLFDAARAGDRIAAGIADEVSTALARGILGVIASFDPSVIVIGGGIATADDLVVAPTVQKVRDASTFHAHPPILRAELGPWAGAWGAALAARDVGVLHG
ncbi:ROK family protein [Agromyces atrinae]|uniref:ROK family protein n=1 Tax=Agromyces atrinae TaxID=592376 RepID=UPI001F5A6EB4|nr:ROK family protein [Agromyces atrinae]MCI2959448.1 ROK family protein [Agromyces atrinae]